MGDGNQKLYGYTSFNDGKIFMKTKKTVIISLIGFGLIVALLIMLRIYNAPKYSSELNKKADCVLNDVDLFRFICASKCDVFCTSTIGLEVKFSLDDSDEKKTREFSLNVSSMPKWKILDEIMRLNPEYYWKEKDGVVNILPSQPDKDFGAVSPLDMTIPRFEVHRITPLFAVEYLRRLGNENNIPITTPFHEVAIKRGIEFNDSGKLEHPESYDAEQLIDVVIPHEVSIRECLNAIALANPPAHWQAIKFRNNKLVLFMDSPQPGYHLDKNQKKTLSHSP